MSVAQGLTKRDVKVSKKGNCVLWTPDTVKDRMRESWDTLRRMPEQCFPAGIKSGWPDIVRDWQEAYGYSSERVKLARPSPGAIDRMHETIGWFSHIVEQPYLSPRVTRAQSRAVWLCCGCGMGPKRAGDVMGFHRNTVRDFRDDGVSVIVKRLKKSRRSEQHLMLCD